MPVLLAVLPLGLPMVRRDWCLYGMEMQQKNHTAITTINALLAGSISHI
ncbi:MAG: hypothetical protein HY051_05830 [Candidatus Aenigmarchaeota archaeon]|nr:hypothetical protein [Candidatus Aenigmarchaeota archaeon]